MSFVVTDGDERAALAATRSLGRLGHVHVVADHPRSLAGCSRWARARHSVPSPLDDPSRFALEIQTLARSVGAAAVLPISDAACRALLPIRDDLGMAVLVAPSEDAYARISDKSVVAELARAQGIEVPAGREAGSIEQAIEIGRELGWPIVLKPVESIIEGPDGRVAKVGVERISDPDALRAAWRRSVGSHRALVQRIVPGWGEGVFVLRSGGRTVAAFAHRRLREKPPEGGVSVIRESIAVAPQRLRQVEAVLDAADFEGAAMAEFKTDGNTAWLMEFNARLWGSLQLAVDAGIDFPRLLVETVLGRRPEAVGGFTTGVRSRWLLGDLDHAIALVRGGRDPEGRSGVGAGLRVLLQPTGPGTRFEVLRASDPRPFVHELRCWLKASGRRGTASLIG